MNLSSNGQRAVGVGVIAAVYVYFLIFAEFAFLRLAQGQGLAGSQLRLIMGCLGAAGIAGSLWTGYAFAPAQAARWLLRGFAGCALAAALSLAARHLSGFAGAAALIGGSLGVLTVSLVGNLPRFLPVGQRGRLIGLGTGLAYAVCNVPAVFAGSAALQTALAAAGCAVGAGAVLWLEQTAGKFMLPSPLPPAHRTEMRRAFAPLIILFLTLIWLDSAAFYILQNTPALNQFGWGSAALQWNNAGVHLAFACLAGWWLDRGGLARVLALAFACLAGAAVCVSSSGPAAGLTHWLYATGVSLYSAALVFAPVAGLDAGQMKQGAARAGALYAVAGWAGSALGIGMAQDLHTIPFWFVAVAAVAAAGSLAWLTGRGGRASLGRAALAGAAVTLAFLVAQTSSARTRLQPAALAGHSGAALGREVYISEGCMNCHSQYVRPSTRDEAAWGPAADPRAVLEEQPPLIGNRRQGPDLMNVGNRRSLAWNRLHLLDPRALSPHSRMPSYAHLFAPGDGRGEALLAYLASRGEDTGAARNDARQQWQPQAGAAPVPRERQAALFRESCSQCHGGGGAGDGSLASQLGPGRPRNLTQAQWQYIPRRDTPEARRLEIARVVRFGLVGTSMPGHESLDDAEVLGLAAYVESLYRPPAPP